MVTALLQKALPVSVFTAAIMAAMRLSSFVMSLQNRRLTSLHTKQLIEAIRLLHRAGNSQQRRITYPLNPKG